ncbi:HAMP domain-containing histidine kinase [Ectothiorhodospiraceae bacterium WFHF3C12]|nr:HAMP domain-containing histidine kinase [Ectothiorhodospiraceae bacterium WFHF3C12]
MSLGRALSSYRLRIPLSLVAASALTALVLGSVVVLQTWRNVERDLVTTGRQLGDALATAVKPALRHDDVWRAFETLRASQGTLFDDRTALIVVDARYRVFAANKPRRFPVATPLADAGATYAALIDKLGAAPPETFSAFPDALPDRWTLLIPIRQDGVSMGALLLVYPDTLMWPRFQAIVGDAALSIALLMATLAPLGWLWGKRITQPILSLTRSMSRVGRDPPGDIRAPMVDRDDELGALTAQFGKMLEALKEKDALEARMVEQERLATVGELAGGVAHEINNPLYGLMTAVDTLRRGSADPRVQRSADLLERGLNQIRETVSALLVEARLDGHPLTRQDVEDVRTLATARYSSGVLSWDNRLQAPVPVPATPIRQVLLNLLLNALEAAGTAGNVACRVVFDGETLTIAVTNSGTAITPEAQAKIFRPPQETGGSGGLGLWVTHQIIRGMQGRIEVDSDESSGTTFRVELPVSGGQYRPANAAGSHRG